jgi:hypothetical protein
VVLTAAGFAFGLYQYRINSEREASGPPPRACGDGGEPDTCDPMIKKMNEGEKKKVEKEGK